MVICFECTRETKTLLDQLIAKGQYRDISEAISVALANQSLLHRSVSDGSLAIPDAFVSSSESQLGSESAVRPSGPQVGVTAIGTKPHLPAIFGAPAGHVRGPIALASSAKVTATSGGNVSQAEWIFGQYNKLLPAKASCRALANFIRDDGGIELSSVARKVAESAGELGKYLHQLDREFDRTRDSLLSTAFPSPANPDKGRIRYANQFVAGVTKQGVLTGLLVDLGLIGRVRKEGAHISLTEVGWQFASLENPVLDGLEANPTSKLSDTEKKLLLRHITKNVSVERSAFLQILKMIRSGLDSPEKLREGFNSKEKETAKNSSFFATQRAGAVSRMADLDLLTRDRDGTRVRYVVTVYGAAFMDSKYSE